MTFETRIPLIERLQDIRKSKVICYLTSVRPNLGAAMSDDAVRVFLDHVLKLPKSPPPKIDVFLCSNGGNGTMPWRLVSLLREYTNHLSVLLPFRAYSAATLFALGADEIVMHPFAEMGPIDPTVTNAYNPIDPQTNQRIGISVEDVKAYISFITSTVGIKHEEELVKTMEILANKVHPLALGNVERFLSQSRLIARKLLLTHMKDEAARHRIDDIIETMASKLYFHGHPINRNEASEELGLAVAKDVPVQVEQAMWDLYLDFEGEMQNRIAFDPMAEIFKQAYAFNQAVAQAQAQAQGQAQAPAPGQPGAPVPTPPGGLLSPIVPPGLSVTMDLIYQIVESAELSSRFKSQRRYVVSAHGPSAEPIVRDEILAQGWEDSPAPPRAVQAPRPPRRK